MKKHCSKCGADKSLKDFYSCILGGKRRYNYWCKACELQKNKEVFQRAYQTPEKRAYVLWNNARQRAKKKNLEFTITKEWVLAGIVDCCEVTGIPFDFGSPSFCLSIDRKDSSIGYTTDNAQLVCWIYNNAKGDNAHSDVMKMAEALCTKMMSY
jgi:hypothetical protein